MSNAVKNRAITIALAGQPNTGKSTVFNRLTGAKQHVGNWPGKTVEQKSGSFVSDGTRYQLMDLPGTYSLTSNSLEEKIARDYLIEDKPDVVIVMADASQLERSLYLLTEIKLLSVPVVLALNMVDVADDQGKVIDVSEMKRRLGVKVVPMVASKGKGVPQLVEAVAEAVSDKPEGDESLFKDLTSYQSIKKIIDGRLGDDAHESWMAVKIIEGDSMAIETIQRNLNASEYRKIEGLLDGSEGGRLLSAGRRYDWINDVIKASVKKSEKKDSAVRSARFDRFATHPVWGKIIAVLIMVVGFAAAMIIAIPIMSAVTPLTVMLSESARTLFTGSFFWFGSMLADGLIPGVGVAVMMLAYIFGVYIVFGLLEDIGYVARLAYVFDGPMTSMGLHGKSFMPLLMSFGCNIAGVTGTRVIDSWRQRMVTLVMVSIVPCLALWAVVSFMGTIFFASAMPLVILSLLVVMVLHLFFTSFLLRKFILPGETTGLIMELPPYHKPNWKTVFGHVWVQVKAFLKRAFTLIAVLSMVTWALSFRADGNMELSVLAGIGKFFDPVTSFFGLDWRLFIALLAAIIAKEASLSVIAVLFGIGGGALSITSFILGSSGVDNAVLAGTIAQTVSPASALAFIFAFFFTIPCVGTIATIYSETKSLKWTIGSSLYYIASSLVFGGIAYRVGLLIF